MGNKLIKNANKVQFRNAQKPVQEWLSIKKMMELFHNEMHREWSDEEKVILKSEGNSKTHIVSYSLMPGLTCMHNGKFPPCYYTGQGYCLYDLRNPNALKNAVHNTVLLMKYTEEFKKSLLLICSTHASMRLHVEGDFANVNHLRIVDEVTRKTNCVVMTYTKKYDMVNKYVERHGLFADNFVLLFSKWEGLEMNNPYNFPVVNVYKTVDEYLKANDEQKCGFITENHLEEGVVYDFVMGNCANCFMNHIMQNGRGGCFDMKHGESTAMLAH